MSHPLAELSAPIASRRASPWSSLIVIALVVLAFGRLCGAEFTLWDDHYTIHQNAHLNPPTLETIRFYWANAEFGLYIPVTYMAWAALAKIAYVGRPDEFGVTLNPLPFHAASISIHLVTSLLVLRFLRRLLRSEVAALLGTLFFALHPTQVESVAWVSGTKDVLCWSFGIAALLIYVRRAQAINATSERRSMWTSWEMPLAALLLVLAILSKPTAMVIPAAMAVVDGLLIRRRWSRVLLDVAPLLLISAAGAVSARVFQETGHVFAAAMWQRPFVIGDALAFDLRKIIWPGAMAIDYGHTPRAVMSWPQTYVVWIVPVTGAAVAWVSRKRAPVVLTAALLLVIGMAPVSGITTFQMQNYSTVTDHYLYFSLLGPALLIGAALDRWKAPALRYLVAAAIIGLGVQSFFQSAFWHDSFTLFTHGMAVNPKSSVCPGNLAQSYVSRTPPRPDLAEPYAARSYEVDPDNIIVANGYASIVAMLGKREEAFGAWDHCYALLALTEAGMAHRAAFGEDVARQMLEMNEPAMALKWAQRSAALDPSVPHVYDTITAAKAAIAATQPATTRATALPPASKPAPAAGPN